MTNAKTQRLDARLTVAQKDTLEHAAALVGTTVSGFVVQAALANAQEVLVQHELLLLSARDSQALAAALATPAEPNAALRRAVEAYDQAVDAA